MSRPGDDPLMLLSRLRTKAHSLWLKSTYPFSLFGDKVSVHYTCELRRCVAHKIAIGSHVLLDREVWLNIPVISPDASLTLSLADGTNIGRRSVISAANRIQIDEHVLFGPSVFITDHNHEYHDTTRPISAQGVTQGGSIIIEKNCWLGYGSMIIASRREVVIGRNSVVGAYAVVRESCPPYSVLVGNPAKVVKCLNHRSDDWTGTDVVVVNNSNDPLAYS